jgi:hypothetical protein
MEIHVLREKQGMPIPFSPVWDLQENCRPRGGMKNAGPFSAALHPFV